MKLIDTNLSKLVIGTDDEATMVKAISTTFETKHKSKRQNTNLKLLDDAVVKTEGNAVLDQIYGKEGILNADDTICFEEKCSELEEDCFQVSSKFVKYFKGRLKTLSKQKVNDPVRQDMVTHNWTHNNCELGRQHSFVEIDHEIFSTVILSLPLIQEGQLSVSGERMCTILVNRLED